MFDAPLTQGMQIAALRGQQGSRTLYQVTVQNSVLNNFFTINMDPPAEKSQRQLDDRHANDIADYIISNPDDYVLGALIYAVDQECIFTPSSISPDLGVLTIPFGANMRSLDGQHRRKGLNNAIDEDEKFALDHTSILIYVEPNVEKRRQMFSDMNATPKVVSKAVNVKFDGRNPFARAAQKIVATHPVLKDTTETEAPRVKGNTGKWYALGSIFESLKGLQVRPGGRIRDWSSFPEELIFQRAKDFFDLLEDSRPEYQALREGISPDIMRTKSILLSGTTLRAIAGAIYIRLNEDGLNKPLTSYKTRLSAIDFRPEAPMWQETGFVSAGKSTPNARNQELIAASRAIAEALKG